MPTAMLAILIMYCMVENVFHRQIGAYYVGFILIVLITSGKTSENNALKNL
jgi:branched-subunit amino acid transport protein AzlD